MAVLLADEAASRKFATALAKTLRRGDVVLLRGDLGMGKTTLAQAIICGLAGEQTEVTSPTFTLLQTYPVVMEDGAYDIWHYDLYRITHPAEMVELAMEDAFATGITLIEWPERMGDALPPQYLGITLTMAAQGEGRLAQIEAKGDAGARWSALDETP